MSALQCGKRRWATWTSTPHQNTHFIVFVHVVVRINGLMVWCHLENMIKRVDFALCSIRCNVQSNRIWFIDRFGFCLLYNFFARNWFLGCHLRCRTVCEKKNKRNGNYGSRNQCQMDDSKSNTVVPFTYHSALTKTSIFDERWVRICLFFCVALKSTWANWHVKFDESYNWKKKKIVVEKLNETAIGRKTSMATFMCALETLISILSSFAYLMMIAWFDYNIQLT